MINNYKIIVATVMTNVVKNKYFPTSKYSLQSFSNTEFVDQVLIVDGHSTDETVECHKNVSDKVHVISGPQWNTDDLSQTNFINQCNSIYEYCNSLNEDVILVFECADVFFSEAFRKELKHVISHVIENNYDYCLLPYSKSITPFYRVFYSYKMFDNEYYNIAISKFSKNDKIWQHGLIDDNTVRDPYRPLKKFIYQWQNFVVSYETWHFDREQFEKKVKAHFAWPKDLGVMEVLQKLYGWKLKTMPVIMTTLQDHPKEAIQVLKDLREDQFGFSMFGYLNSPVTWEQYKNAIKDL